MAIATFAINQSVLFRTPRGTKLAGKIIGVAPTGYHIKSNAGQRYFIAETNIEKGAAC